MLEVFITVSFASGELRRCLDYFLLLVLNICNHEYKRVQLSGGIIYNSKTVIKFIITSVPNKMYFFVVL